jgi:hypothetical protein
VFANSVLSEQAFSIINYIYSKTRNSLSLVCADKVQFINMNIQALAMQKRHKPSEEELLAWEDEYRLEQA